MISHFQNCSRVHSVLLLNSNICGGYFWAAAVLTPKRFSKLLGDWVACGSQVDQAPFSYLTLYCLIVNESSGPKRVTHHIFYSVQKIAVVQRKKKSYPDPTAPYFQSKIFD